MDLNIKYKTRLLPEHNIGENQEDFGYDKDF